MFDDKNRTERIIDVSLECMSCDHHANYSGYKWPVCETCQYSAEKIHYEGHVGDMLLSFVGIDWKNVFNKVKDVCAKYTGNRHIGNISYFEWMELDFADLKSKLRKYWDVFLFTYDWHIFYCSISPDESVLTLNRSNPSEFYADLENIANKKYYEYAIIQQYIYGCLEDESFYDLNKYHFADKWFMPGYIKTDAIQPLTALETEYTFPEFQTRWADDEEKAFKDNFIISLNQEFDKCRVNENPLYRGFNERYYFDQYDAQSTSPLLNILLKKVLEIGFRFKKCANCGTPFIPYKRQDRIYCDKPSPQDITKTCQEYGARQSYQDSLSTNEAMKLYRNIYMAKQMMVKRNPDITEYADDFETFKRISKKWKNEIKNGITKEEDYLCWLKAVKDKSYLSH